MTVLYLTLLIAGTTLLRIAMKAPKRQPARVGRVVHMHRQR